MLEQHLYHLRGKLHHARNILFNMRNTFGVVAEHELSVAREQNLCLAIHDDFQRTLRNISREVENYIETTHKLLCISDDLKSMVSSDIILIRAPPPALGSDSIVM